MALQWLTSGLNSAIGRKSIGDLQSAQKLIDHANNTVSHDFAEVKKAMTEVLEARKHLYADLNPERRKLSPICQGYVEQRERLLFGKDSKPPLKDLCMLAQGDVNVALGLGQMPQGCVNSCRSGVDGTQDPPGKCNLSGCQGKLRATRQLEMMLGGLEWKKRDAEVQQLCAKHPDWDLAIPPPAGWEAGPSTDELERPEDGDAPKVDDDAPKVDEESMLPADIAVLVLPPRLRGSCCRSRAGCAATPPAGIARACGAGRRAASTFL